ncbi:MAG: hypothetical protein R6X25_15725 [Candidatus Krumholzibacteriia bacterium]
MENVVVILVVVVALVWGVRSIWHTARRVKAAGEAPPADGICATDPSVVTKPAPGCGCSAAGSCPAAERCAVPSPDRSHRKSD